MGSHWHLVPRVLAVKFVNQMKDLMDMHYLARMVEDVYVPGQ